MKDVLEKLLYTKNALTFTALISRYVHKLKLYPIHSCT